MSVAGGIVLAHSSKGVLHPCALPAQHVRAFPPQPRAGYSSAHDITSGAIGRFKSLGSFSPGGAIFVTIHSPSAPGQQDQCWVPAAQVSHS